MTRQERSWILQDFGNSAYSIAITTALLPVYFKTYATGSLSPTQATAFWGYANAFASAPPQRFPWWERTSGSFVFSFTSSPFWALRELLFSTMHF